MLVTLHGCVFLFFLINELHSLIPAVIAQSFNPTAALVMSIVTLNNEGNAEDEAQPPTVETKI